MNIVTYNYLAGLSLVCYLLSHLLILGDSYLNDKDIFRENIPILIYATLISLLSISFLTSVTIVSLSSRLS